MGAIVVLAVLLRWPGFLAGLTVGLWFVTPVVLPGLAGFIPTLTVLGVSAVAALLRYGRKGGNGAFKIVLLFALFLFAVMAREFIGGDVRKTWAPIGIAMLVGVIIALIGSYGRSREQLIWGFAVGNSVYAIAEIIRVAGGGALHASYGAFQANPIFAGHLLGIAFFALLALWPRQRTRLWFFLPFLILLGGTLALTLSRGPIIAAVLAVLFIVIFRKKAKTREGAALHFLLMMVSVVAAVVAYVYLQGARNSENDALNTEVREDHWTAAWSTIRANPIFGTGTDALFDSTPLDRISPVGYPHNILLETWETYGLLPLVILLVILLLVFRQLNVIGRGMLIFIVTCYLSSGTLSVSVTLWIGVALSIVVGRSDASLAPRENLDEVADSSIVTAGR
ncbi:O-antigen ligase family protein [Microbacterium sp. NPDC089698]|uniref:O-antigen ligase family protein n=1 Tax=Microbacterium sp. NPDC089698 TaxID=3364200 RepID=UPI003805ED41